MDWTVQEAGKAEWYMSKGRAVGRPFGQGPYGGMRYEETRSCARGVRFNDGMLYRYEARWYMHSDGTLRIDADDDVTGDGTLVLLALLTSPP